MESACFPFFILKNGKQGKLLILLKNKIIAGMRKWLSRQAHNLKIVGSNPTPAPPRFYLNF